jgi:hypothetical protein
MLASQPAVVAEPTHRAFRWRFESEISEGENRPATPPAATVVLIFSRPEFLISNKSNNEKVKYCIPRAGHHRHCSGRVCGFRLKQPEGH